MPNTTPLAVELYQRAGDGLVPLLVRATGGDTTDIEALIAAAIKQHNEDPEAHPDLRAALEEAKEQMAGLGGLVMTIPAVTAPASVYIGHSVRLGMSAQSLMTGGSIASFLVTVGDAAPVEMPATDGAAAYSFTAEGADGDTLTVSVVAVDNNGIKSRPGTAGVLLKTLPDAVTLAAIRSARTFLRSLDNGKTWSPTSGGYLSNGVFHYGTDGTLLGIYSSDMVRSADNGATWSERQTLDGGGVVSVNGGNLAASADGTLYVGGEKGTLLRSTDMFVTHDVLTIPDETQTIYHIIVTPQGTLLATEGLRKMHRSTDGGQTWAVVALPTHNFYSHLFIGEAILAGDFNGSLYRSTDDGLTWTFYASTGIGKVVRSLLRTDSGVLLAASSTSKILARSTDDGATWSTQTPFGSDYINSLTLLPDSTVLAGVDSGIYKSPNDGATWTKIYSVSSTDTVNSLYTFVPATGA